MSTTINRIYGALAGMLLCLPVMLMAAPINDNFDHFTTGFSLTGGHRSVECDACHNSGNFRGTPRDCATCHSALMNTGAVVKSGIHIQSSNECESCHSTLAWDDVRRVNHMSVLGNCNTCHKAGGPATAPPTGDSIHTPPPSDCFMCHRTSTWVATHYDHSGVVPGTCSNSCHVAGGSATPPPTGYHTSYPSIFINDPLSCGKCHNTHAWRPAPYDHTGPQYATIAHTFTQLGCQSCHGPLGGYPGTLQQTSKGPNCKQCHVNTASREHNNSTIEGYCADCHEHANALSRGKW